MAEKNDQGFWNFFSIVLFILTFGLIYYYFVRSNTGLFFSATVLDIFLISIATFRLIRLASYDKVTAFKRNFFMQFDRGPGRTIYEIMICPWCVGIWVALLIVPFYFLTSLGKIFVLILAIAGIGSFIQITANRIWK